MTVQQCSTTQVPSTKRPPLLAQLRHDKSNSDCIIVADGEEIPAHLCIISKLALFFDIALNGQFKEATDKRVTIGNATARSVHIVLDYAYELSVKDKIEKEWKLLLEVWELAHRFSVDDLRNLCEHIAFQRLNTEKLLDLYYAAKLFGSEQSRGIAFQCIAHNFATVFKEYEGVARLTFEEMCELVKSPELVTSEMTLIDSIYEWVHSGKEREIYTEQLLANVHFELFKDWELNDIVDKYGEWLPKSVLLKTLMRVPNSTTASRPLSVILGGNWGKIGQQIGTTVVLPLSSLKKVYFDILHWTTSAVAYYKKAQLIFRLQFERRNRFSRAGRVKLLEDVQGYSFHIKVETASSSGARAQRICSDLRVGPTAMIEVVAPADFAVSFSESVAVLSLSATELNHGNTSNNNCTRYKRGKRLVGTVRLKQ